MPFESGKDITCSAGSRDMGIRKNQGVAFNPGYSYSGRPENKKHRAATFIDCWPAGFPIDFRKR